VIGRRKIVWALGIIILAVFGAVSAIYPWYNSSVDVHDGVITHVSRLQVEEGSYAFDYSITIFPFSAMKLSLIRGGSVNVFLLDADYCRLSTTQVHLPWGPSFGTGVKSTHVQRITVPVQPGARYLVVQFGRTDCRTRPVLLPGE